MYTVVVLLTFGLSVSAVKLASTLPHHANRAQQIVVDVTDTLHRAKFSRAPTTAALSNVDVSRLVGLLEPCWPGWSACWATCSS